MNKSIAARHNLGRLLSQLVGGTADAHETSISIPSETRLSRTYHIKADHPEVSSFVTSKVTLSCHTSFLFPLFMQPREVLMLLTTPQDTNQSLSGTPYLQHRAGISAL